jgi:hypothetical protein
MDYIRLHQSTPLGINWLCFSAASQALNFHKLLSNNALRRLARWKIGFVFSNRVPLHVVVSDLDFRLKAGILALFGFVFLPPSRCHITIISFHIRLCAVLPIGKLALFFQIRILLDTDLHRLTQPLNLIS